MRVKFYKRVYRLKPGWRWTLFSDNNKVVGASTEDYVNRVDCIDNFVLVTGYTTMHDTFISSHEVASVEDLFDLPPR